MSVTIGNRTYHRPRLWDLGYSEIYRAFAEKPNVPTKFNKYWIKWTVGKSTLGQRNFSYGDEILKFYSYDRGITWHEFDSFYSDKDPLYKEMLEEAKQAKKEALKARNRELAKQRRERLKAEAEERGVSLEEMKKIKSKRRVKKQKDKKQSKAAVRLAKQTNKKMKIGASLKTLIEVADNLQEKLLDGTDLMLHHVDSRIHKIDEATRILEEWSKPKK